MTARMQEDQQRLEYLRQGLSIYGEPRTIEAQSTTNITSHSTADTTTDAKTDGFTVVQPRKKSRRVPSQVWVDTEDDCICTCCAPADPHDAVIEDWIALLEKIMDQNEKERLQQEAEDKENQSRHERHQELDPLEIADQERLEDLPLRHGTKSFKSLTALPRTSAGKQRRYLYANLNAIQSKVKRERRMVKRTRQNNIRFDRDTKDKPPSLENQSDDE
jgi:hypothetical protein